MARVVGRQAVLRGRDRTLHQRRSARARRLLRPSERESRASSRQRTTRRRRVELRRAEERAFVASIRPSACSKACSSTERAVGSAPEIAASRRRGEEYLLERGLFRRRSTGEVANPEFLEFAFPPRYHYDILRALDYFRAAGARPDPRMSDAVQVVASRRRADGRWLLERSYDESLAFPFDESVGQASRWNSVRALRVLRWHERPSLEATSRR